MQLLSNGPERPMKPTEGLMELRASESGCPVTKPAVRWFLLAAGWARARGCALFWARCHRDGVLDNCEFGLMRLGMLCRTLRPSSRLASVLPGLAIITAHGNQPLFGLNRPLGVGDAQWAFAFRAGGHSQASSVFLHTIPCEFRLGNAR